MSREEIKDNDAKGAIGCVLGVWHLCVITPMWLFLIYQILEKIQPPVSTWVLFWCYVPACIVGSIFSSCFTLLTGNAAK